MYIKNWSKAGKTNKLCITMYIWTNKVQTKIKGWIENEQLSLHFRRTKIRNGK